MRNSTSVFKNKYRSCPFTTNHGNDVPRSFYLSQRPEISQQRVDTNGRREGKNREMGTTYFTTKDQRDRVFQSYPQSSEKMTLKKMKSAQKIVNGRLTNNKKEDHQQAVPQYSDPSISDLKWHPASGSSLILVSPQTFVASIPKHQLFFCCKCYQYIFQVQKHRHFPQCRDQLPFLSLPKEKVIRIAWQRLEKMVELSKYTSTRHKQVEDLWQEVKKCEFCRIFLINYPHNIRFFKLDQIVQAFVFTYEHLLKGKIHQSSTIDFFTCY